MKIKLTKQWLFPEKVDQLDKKGCNRPLMSPLRSRKKQNKTRQTIKQKGKTNRKLKQKNNKNKNINIGPMSHSKYGDFKGLWGSLTYYIKGIGLVSEQHLFMVKIGRYERKKG